MISLEKYELLEDLLKGKLSDAKAGASREEISSDPELQEAYESLQLVNKVIEEKEFLEIRKEAEQGYHRYQKYLSSRRWKIALGGAGLLLLAAIFLFSQSGENRNVQEPNNLKEIQEPESWEAKPVQDMEKTVAEIPDKPESKPTPVKRAQTHMAEKADELENLKMPDTTSSLSEVVVTEVDTSIDMDKSIAVVKKSPETVLPEDICGNAEHELILKPSPACQGEENGSIQVLAKAGDLSFDYKVFSMEGEEVFGNQLSKGSYLVKASFDDACTKERKIAVAEKICPKDLLLNRSMEKDIEIPYKQGVFRVTDAAGQVYFELNLDAYDTSTWDGRSSTGAFKAGYYNFQVIFEGKLLGFGSITLLN